ncbi:hypothetical protein A5888_002902 [Enterococcus sp. 9E7_DIV0242]|uniref:Gram-positive cocci surface proteins LPxTG domain-containing protein n=2 Tax=Candidatus Enterococcus clewellii TaxID=1834193 RepID=A0A242K8Y8_9ENTE|nr:hypothetical protein [Enterococcus sp. 9E7_DIV0242]OTP17527.1 hypothetical protein A5888_001665 [Enterococcus sp. 9E7_DIV0242]
MMKLFKQLNCFLLILGSIALTFLISSQMAQATVTNGNIRYFEGEKEVSESFSSSESSSTAESSTTTTTTSSATTDSTATDTTTTTSSAYPTNNTSTSSDGVIVKPAGSSGASEFLKTNDTVNYIFVVVGVIFVLIAVYNLRKS